jgi:hypothetical protein
LFADEKWGRNEWNITLGGGNDRNYKFKSVGREIKNRKSQRRLKRKSKRIVVFLNPNLSKKTQLTKSKKGCFAY